MPFINDLFCAPGVKNSPLPQLMLWLFSSVYDSTELLYTTKNTNMTGGLLSHYVETVGGLLVAMPSMAPLLRTQFPGQIQDMICVLSLLNQIVVFFPPLYAYV